MGLVEKTTDHTAKVNLIEMVLGFDHLGGAGRFITSGPFFALRCLASGRSPSNEDPFKYA